jgi:hypothetical protein
MDRTSRTQTSAGSAAEAGDPEMSLGPTVAETEAWAEKVRLRRQAWVDGPTEEEKQEWQRRERARRIARMEGEAESGSCNGDSARFDPYEERRRLQARYMREVRLATEGVGALFATLPFRALAELVVAGREWEEGFLRPARRRWIPFNDDDV